MIFKKTKEATMSTLIWTVKCDTVDVFKTS